MFQANGDSFKRSPNHYFNNSNRTHIMTLIRYQRPLAPRATFFNRWPDLEDEIDRVFNTAFSTLFSPATNGAAWGHPRVDLFEDKDNFFFRAELPGMKKEDIKVELGDGVLTLSGTRRSFAGDGQQERSFEFSRSLSVPARVQEKDIVAKYEDGVLTVTLPKAEEVKPKHIAVQVK